MKFDFQSFRKSTLFKATSLNSVSYLVKIVSSLIVAKALAIFIGPAGLSLVGNFRNFFQTSKGIGLLGSENGVIKLIAEKGKPSNSKDILKTSLILVFMASIITGIVIFLFSEKLSLFLFQSSSYKEIIKVFGLALPLHTINVWILSVVNGLKKYAVFTKLVIIGVLLNLIFVTGLSWKLKTNGALLAMVLAPIVQMLISVGLVLKSNIISFDFFDGKLSKKVLSILSNYTLMSVFSLSLIPLVYILIRNHIISEISREAAGIWEAVLRVSGIYLMFFSSLFTLYLLPKLAEQPTYLLKKTVLDFYKLVIPIMILVFIPIYFLREFIIEIIFTDEFSEAQSLFLWQLIGDFFRVLAFSLAFQFQAKARLFPYLIGEVIIVSCFYFSARYFIDLLGLPGVVRAYAVTYLLYFVTVIILLRKDLFLSNEGR